MGAGVVSSAAAKQAPEGGFHETQNRAAFHVQPLPWPMTFRKKLSFWCNFRKKYTPRACRTFALPSLLLASLQSEAQYPIIPINLLHMKTKKESAPTASLALSIVDWQFPSLQATGMMTPEASCFKVVGTAYETKTTLNPKP